MVTLTSWWRFASWRVLLPCISVDTVAWLMADCKCDNWLEISGRVFVAAYWRLPMSPRRARRSCSVTGSSGVVLRLGSIEIAGMSRTYWDCERMIPLSPLWDISIPVKMKLVALRDPKEYFWDSSNNFWSKYSSPPHRPSSTCTPRIPESWLLLGLWRTKTQGSNGDCWNPNRRSSFNRVWYHRNGASINPYALLFSWQHSCGFKCIARANSGTGSIVQWFGQLRILEEMQLWRQRTAVSIPWKLSFGESTSWSVVQVWDCP